MEPRFCTVCGTALEENEVDGRTRPYCPTCDAVRWRNPVPVAWVLLRDGADVLMVKRREAPEKGMWDVPGGFVEYGESLRAAGVRELAEETGVVVEPDALEPAETVTFRRRERQVVGVVFTAEYDLSDAGIRAGADAAAARVWDRSRLLAGEEPVRPVCRPLLDHGGS